MNELATEDKIETQAHALVNEAEDGIAVGYMRSHLSVAKTHKHTNTQTHKHTNTQTHKTHEQP
jgi:hypothetical protein